MRKVSAPHTQGDPPRPPPPLTNSVAVRGKHPEGLPLVLLDALAAVEALDVLVGVDGDEDVGHVGL